VEQLTPEGLRVVNELAQRYGFSQEAVIHMMFAMLRGRGGMAQFNHPEFAGSGQWMRGGMLMIGDMFNHSLKARVEGLCQAIAAQLASQPELFPAGSFQSQNQSGGGQQMQVGTGGQQMLVGGMAAMPPMGVGGGGLFVPDPRDTWWPKELGTPSALGAQNDLRYAFFPTLGRLAVQANGQVSVYDTGGHHIAGLSQQQAPGGAVVFTTPGGSVSLSSLSSIGVGTSQQAQSSGGGSQQQQQVSTGLAPMTSMGSSGGMSPLASMDGMAPMSFSPMAAAEPWWPAELGTPSATGSQNEVRYAVFPAARRLAVDMNGRVTMHDIGDLQISGCSQASGMEGGARFTTNRGAIPLASLPEVRPSAQASPAQPPEAVQATPQPVQEIHQEDVLDALTRLGELKAKGILTEEEFAAKKAELLRRL
jgi:hypothetical protein